jgi:glutathione peroxidase-family protein
LAFPSREFGSQEFAADEDIQKFAEGKNFPGTLMKLGKVTGDDVPQVWNYMREQTGAKDPTWNFKGKFLVSKTGVVSVPTNLEADIAALMAEEP